MKFNSEDLAVAKQKYDAGEFKLDENRIDGVQIFAVGTWNGRTITESDLDELIESYELTKNSVRPYLKLGHDDDQKLLQKEGLPAAGWVENFRKEGGKIVADLVDIPRKIYQLIQNKAYRKVSVEVFKNLDFQGTKIKQMIGAVALLGSELPGVLSLDDIISLYSMNKQFSTAEKFDSAKNIDTIEICHDELKDKEPEMDVEKLKFQLEQAEKEKADLQAKIDADAKSVEKYQADLKAANDAKDAAEAKLIEAQAAEKKANVEKFVTELQAEKLCSKAMAPMVAELLGDEKEKYAIADAEFSKFDLVKKILESAKDGAKVNFSEQTADSKKSQEPDAAAIEKYMADHEVSYSEAYRQITRAKA